MYLWGIAAVLCARCYLLIYCKYCNCNLYNSISEGQNRRQCVYDEDIMYTYVYKCYYYINGVNESIAGWQMSKEYLYSVRGSYWLWNK